MNETIRFSGSAREYFPIWIKNLLLTIVTLGVYSAWGENRTQHYFLSHTHLNSQAFDYQKDPYKTLFFRGVVAGSIGIYLLISCFIPDYTGYFSLILIWFFPALLVLMREHHVQSTAYGDTSFSYRRDFKKIYLTFAFPAVILSIWMMPVTSSEHPHIHSPDTVTNHAEHHKSDLPAELSESIPEGEREYLSSHHHVTIDADEYRERAVMLSFMIALTLVLIFFWPLWERMFIHMKTENTALTGRYFRFKGTPGKLYLIYIMVLISIIGAFIFMIFLSVFLGNIGGGIASIDEFTPEGGSNILHNWGFVMLLITSLIITAICALRNAWVFRWRVNHTEYDGNYFVSSVTGTGMCRIYLTNLIAVLMTLGLAIPWAMVRSYQYRVESITVQADTDSVS